jgi:hypothetical protein
MEADRHVSPQPVEYISENGLVRYNKRKLSELPHCLVNLDPNISLENACQLVYFNYEFMHAKFVCENLNDILEELKNFLDETKKYDLSRNSQALSALTQLKLFQKLLKMCGMQVDDNPDSFAFQATSRLLFFYGKQKHITRFIDECDRESVRQCAFVSTCLQQSPVGGFLISTSNIHKESISQVLCSYPYIFTYSASKINVYLIGNDASSHLFQVKLPKKSKIDDFILFKKQHARLSKKRSSIFDAQGFFRPQENNNSVTIYIFFSDLL